MKPLILISNDDGIDALGVHCLIDYTMQALSNGCKIVAVCPDGARSGQSAAITHNAPLRLYRRPSYKGAEMWAVSGTPVDCVKLAMHTLFKEQRPDLMLSGINHGSNAATCVNYSGTMGCVLEACMLGLPAIGFSLTDYHPDADFSPAREVVDKVVKGVLEGGLPAGICLNVNIPDNCCPEGIKVTRAAKGHWTDEYREYKDPSGQPFYWLTGHFVNAEPDAADTDEYWLARKYATVVPTSPDLSSPGNNVDIESLLS